MLSVRLHPPCRISNGTAETTPAATGVVIKQMLHKIPKIEVDCTVILPESAGRYF
jgi:hypothetical protein